MLSFTTLWWSLTSSIFHRLTCLRKQVSILKLTYGFPRLHREFVSCTGTPRNRVRRILSPLVGSGEAECHAAVQRTRRFLPREMKAEYETPSVPLRNYRGWRYGVGAARCNVDATRFSYEHPLLGSEVREASTPSGRCVPESAKCF